MSKEYYNIPFTSNSTLGWLKISPAYFKAYKEGEFKTKDTKSTNLGTVIHKLVLENKDFDNTYSVIKTENIPTSSQQHKFCESFDIPEDLFNEHAINLYPILYSCKGKTPEKIKKEALEMLNTYREYIMYLRESKGKEQVSGVDYRTALLCYTSISEHKKANTLLLKNINNKMIESLTEYPVYFKYKEMDFKALIDKVIINHKLQKITLLDFKTTSEYLKDFHKSFRKYDYDRQLAFYKFALCCVNPDLDHYEWEFLMPVVETHGLYECKVFNIPKEVIDLGKLKYEFLLDKLFKYEELGYSHSEEYYENDGIEELFFADSNAEADLGF